MQQNEQKKLATSLNSLDQQVPKSEWEEEILKMLCVWEKIFLEMEKRKLFD